MEVANDLLRTLREPIVIENDRLYVGGSIGVATYPMHAANPPELMRRADMAMYAAKRGQRGAAVYSADLDDDNSSTSLALFGELRHAIDNEEFRLYFQPKLTSRLHQLLTVEALIRWQHPERGLLRPGDFIPIVAIELIDAHIQLSGQAG